ncbi:MAG: tetratricopeptide repeat protein [Acidobacteriia bacterium]|nr:tetratricopeptide repeat protein [Terriglobia bacterium]
MTPTDHESTALADARPGPGKTSDRDAILLLSLFGLAILFTMAGVAARLFHAKERSLGQEWYARGEADLKAGRAPVAIEDFRNALAYARDDPFYRLHLALALAAADRNEEARAHLLNLWERQPGDGTVNLELARLAARQGKTADAVRYFHNAIFGVWPGNPDEARRDVRFELCDFLLARGLKAEAQAALMELATKLPKDADLHVRVADLFLAAADYPHALAEFRQALDVSNRNEQALAGAGEVAFRMGDFRTARRYLDRAVRLNPQKRDAAGLLEITNLVLALDPQARGISARERAARVVRAFGLATARLEACAAKRQEVLRSAEPDPEIRLLSDRAKQIRPKVKERTLARDADLLTQTTDLVFEVEQVCQQKCEPATGGDLALLLLARQRGGAEP